MISMTAVLYAKDLDRVAAFYAGVLPLEKMDTAPDDFVCLQSQDGSVELTIVAAPAAVADRIIITDPLVRRETTPVKLSFAVTDLAEARQHVSERGGRVHGPGTEWTWRGMVHCDGHDPEGNVFQLRAA